MLKINTFQVSGAYKWLIFLLLTSLLIYLPNWWSIMGSASILSLEQCVVLRGHMCCLELSLSPWSFFFHLELNPASSKPCISLWHAPYQHWHKVPPVLAISTAPFWIHGHWGLDQAWVFYAPSRFNDLSFKSPQEGDWGEKHNSLMSLFCPIEVAST